MSDDNQDALYPWYIGEFDQPSCSEQIYNPAWEPLSGLRSRATGSQAQYADNQPAYSLNSPEADAAVSSQALQPFHSSVQRLSSAGRPASTGQYVPSAPLYSSHNPTAPTASHSNPDHYTMANAQKPGEPTHSAQQSSDDNARATETSSVDPCFPTNASHAWFVQGTKTSDGAGSPISTWKFTVHEKGTEAPLKGVIRSTPKLSAYLAKRATAHAIPIVFKNSFNAEGPARSDLSAAVSKYASTGFTITAQSKRGWTCYVHEKGVTWRVHEGRKIPTWQPKPARRITLGSSDH